MHGRHKTNYQDDVFNDGENKTYNVMLQATYRVVSSKEIYLKAQEPQITYISKHNS